MFVCVHLVVMLSKVQTGKRWFATVFLDFLGNPYSAGYIKSSSILCPFRWLDSGQSRWPCPEGNPAMNRHYGAFDAMEKLPAAVGKEEEETRRSRRWIGLPIDVPSTVIPQIKKDISFHIRPRPVENEKQKTAVAFLHVRPLVTE